MKIFKYLKILGVVLFIIFEEVLWNNVAVPIYNNIVSLRITHRFREYITSIEKKYLLLLIFITPVFVDIILSVMFTSAMAHGLLFAAIGIYIIKALVSIIMIIIFQIGKKQLTEFYLIRYSYGLILKLRRSKTFRRVKIYSTKIKNELNKFKVNYINGDSEITKEINSIYDNLKK